MTSPGAADLALAAGLVVVNALLSLALRLHLHRSLVWAAARMTAQLLLVGSVLRLVFAHASPGLTLTVVAVMVLLAAREVAVRPKERLSGHGNHVIALGSVAASTGVTMVLVLGTSIRPDPWYDPRYLVALVGIVLGSALNAASLAIDSMLSGARRDRAGIEARLALGATAAEAFAGLVQSSVQRALVPTINQMTAAGIITLPGIMTGQILAGASPLDAARYQILVLLLLAGAGGLAAIGAAGLARRRLTDDRGRLRLDRLTRP